MSRTRLAIAAAMALSLLPVALASAAPHGAAGQPARERAHHRSGERGSPPVIPRSHSTSARSITRSPSYGYRYPAASRWTPSATNAVTVTGTHDVGRLGRYLLVRLPSGSSQLHLVISPQALHEGPALTRYLRTQVRQVHLRFWITVHEGSAKRTLRPLIKGT